VLPWEPLSRQVAGLLIVKVIPALAGYRGG